jgi:hypothetical protein
VLGDPDLDNPKFLFDAGGADETPTGGTTIPEGVPFASGDVTQMHDALAEEDDATPAAKRAPTPLMGLDPEASARQKELTRELKSAAPPAAPDPADSPEDLFDFGRQDDYELTPVPGREPALAANPQPAPRPAPPARELDPDPEPDTLLKLAGEEVDEAIARWDAPVAAPPAPPRHVEVLRPASPAATRGPVARAKPAVPEPLAVEREAEAAPVFPAEPPPAPPWLQALVALVALALVGTGVRASLRQLTPPAAAPRVQGLGWSAEQIRARPARDAAGDPTIEIVGTLRGPAGTPVPAVRVSMLDAAGRPIGNGADARIGASGGFAVTLGEPPATGAAFRIELSEPDEPPPPVETTTASPTPLPAPAEPRAATAPDSAPAAPEPDALR